MVAGLKLANVATIAAPVGVMLSPTAGCEPAIRTGTSDSWIIAIVAVTLVLRWKLPTAWVVLAGGLAGVVLAAFGA